MKRAFENPPTIFCQPHQMYYKVPTWGQGLLHQSRCFEAISEPERNYCCFQLLLGALQPLRGAARRCLTRASTPASKSSREGTTCTIAIVTAAAAMRTGRPPGRFYTKVSRSVDLGDQPGSTWAFGLYQVLPVQLPGGRPV